MGPNFFSGFTRLCKGLALVLAGGYALVQIFPTAVTYLTLIPARTIPFVWNLITAGYIEQSLPRDGDPNHSCQYMADLAQGKKGVEMQQVRVEEREDDRSGSYKERDKLVPLNLFQVIISTLGLLFIGKLLEPIWGPKEFMKFILVVNFLTSVCVFVTAIALYYITRQESYLYVPVSGFHGVVSGFLVGIKQIMPDQEVGLISVLRINAKWLPSLLVLLSIAVSLFTEEALSYLPTLIFGIYTSWIYLRYLQKKPETNLRGDPSDDFAFSAFFPEFLRPIVGPIASVFHRLLCGRFEISDQDKGSREGGSPLPGSDPIEASRRRERGARALEQRLAAEKLSAADSVGGTSRGDGVDNV